MAQYDLLLTQNVHASSIEFAEKYVNLGKGGLLTINATGVPTAFPAGANGYMIVYDSTEPTGLRAQAVSAGHTQNTDTGTTSTTFHIDNDASGPKLKNNAGALESRNAADDAYADFRAKNATFDKVTISAIPSAGTDATNKTYVDGLLAANDAMVFKGTIGAGGTIEIAAFNSLATYNTGWTYKVITAGTVKGKEVEIGDTIYALETRTGTGNVDADWAVVQANIDGAVTSGETSVIDGAVAVFSGTSGKIIREGITLGTMASETASNYVPKSLYDPNSMLYATTDNTPVALAVGSSTFVGRKATGDIAAMSAAEARAVLNVADGANNYAHPNHSGDVTSAGDGATTIAAGAVTLAKMADVATGTLFYRKTAGAGAPEVQTLATLKSDLGTMPVAWVSAPATKTSTGSAGQVARDDNFFYLCTATNVWKRSAIATNW